MFPHVDEHAAEGGVFTSRVHGIGIDHPRHPQRADDPAAGIVERLLGGERPDGGAIEAAHEFDPAVDRLALEHTFIVEPVLIGEMGR